MGAWGYAPWDNDGAADWFGELMEDSGLIRRVGAALEADPADDPEVTRAAAYVLATLGRIYVWDGSLVRHLRLAIARMERLREVEYGDVPEYHASLDREIQALKDRLAEITRPDGPEWAEG